MKRLVRADGPGLAADIARADYGIDAPGVIRNLGVVGFVMLAISLSSFVGFLPTELVMRPLGLVTIRFPLATNGLIVALAFLGTGAWMYLGSRFGKLGERDRLLNTINWTGHERVLDVGCGRGLLLVGVAKRLTDGTVTGIDIWQSEDLSGNRADVPLRNAERENVKERVTVQTADMRRLPFDADSFDVIVSRAAVHNLYAAADRATAIREIARVLKPGGQALIADIRHHREYAMTFAENGCRDVRLLDSKLVSVLCAMLTMGSLRPNTMLVRKL